MNMLRDSRIDRNSIEHNLLRKGMTLLEVMIIIIIIGLLATLAMPAFEAIRIRVQDTAFISDIRTLAQSVFEAYALHNVDYPPNVAPGVFPPQAITYMHPNVDWDAGPRIGGVWDWDRAAAPGQTMNGYYAGLGVVGPDRTTAQMRKIDERLDDGNLSSGTFQAKPGGYIYILSE